MKKRSEKTNIVAITNAQDMLSRSETTALLSDICSLIEAARRRVSMAANAEMVLLYWHIGDRIRKDILGMERADYGKQIVQTLSGKLILEYGRGYSRTNIFHMIRFAEVFSDLKIVQTLTGQLGWSHFVQIIALDDPLKRDFYAEMCRIERWSTRTLHAKIQGMLYERTALTKKSEKLITQELAALRDEDRMTPDLVFRDPYFLDFLGLSDSYSERDLESAILRELERFLLELGTDFTFVALGKFQAQDKGQMELYLRWLEKYETRDGEESPLGLILCAEKTAEHVELLQLETSGIRVAEYLTELPPRPLLEAKLHEAIRMAREHIASREVSGLERK
ncbi:Putative nuclease YhcG [Methanosarcinales archaeon]|nr:Putative nuclease YhcG [Methanosarcinales archaeon]